MGRSVISVTALLAAASALQPVAVQTAQAASSVTPWKADTVPAVAETASAPIGFVLAPGVTFVPQAFSEIGFDSNPSQTFFNQKGSGFIRSGVGFNLSKVTQRMVANLYAAGSMLDYFNDSTFDESLRFAGIVKGNVTYLVQPGLTVSSGAFLDYDGQSINKNRTGGANIEFGYRDELVSSALRARFLDVQYLNNVGLVPSPLFLTSAFNYNRTDATWTGLLGNGWRVAPYAEVIAARVEYTDQPIPELVNRSADDYDAKAGVRVPISPYLSTDIGWRFNWRDTDDRRITSYYSNFFDASLTWRPSPFFFFTGSMERFIGEPSTNFAVLSDVRAYTVKATYLPVPGVTVAAAGGWQAVKDIGSDVHYHSNYANAQAAWDYNNHVQFYTALYYQNYEFDWRNLEYNEVRIMAGVRIVPDGQDLWHGESLESLFARLADSHGLAGSELTVWTGYSWFGLPDMKMVTVTGGPFFDRALEQKKNADGDIDGWRTDVRLANFAESAWPNGHHFSFGLSGFFANYQDSAHSHCMYSLTTDCAIVNIADSDHTKENNTGPFGELYVTASRNVNYYGAALDARLGEWAGGGLKDGPPAQFLSPFKVGVAARWIDRNAKLTSSDPLVFDPAQYKEELNTHYYGGFVGVEQKAALGEGWAVALDGTAGLYYTDTQYQGRFYGYTPLMGTGYVKDIGIVNASLDRGSFIGTVRVGLNRELGWSAVGLFGQGEYLSYVPSVVYNNNDLAGGAPWGIVGTQIGTRIKSNDALNFTTGVNLTVRMN